MINASRIDNSIRLKRVELQILVNYLAIAFYSAFTVLPANSDSDVVFC